jgi:hypothetical protein
MQEPAAAPATGRRRGDAFDPSQNPNAPGAPRALGGGQLPIANEAPVGAPGGRGAGEPLDLGSTSPRDPGGAAPPRAPGAGAAFNLAALQPPKDEFDLGIGYMQRRLCAGRRDHEEFAQKYPTIRWSGFAILARRELFQRQKYRDAAKPFSA